MNSRPNELATREDSYLSTGIVRRLIQNGRFRPLDSAKGGDSGDWAVAHAVQSSHRLIGQRAFDPAARNIRESAMTEQLLAVDEHSWTFSALSHPDISFRLRAE